MTQYRPPGRAGQAAVIGAIALGAAAAAVVGTIGHVALNFLVGGHVPGHETSKIIVKMLFAGAALLIGVIVGGAVMMTRRAGPLAPILAAVAAVVAGRLASAFGFLVWHLSLFFSLPFQGDLVAITDIVFKVHGAWGYTLLVLPALTAGAIATLRVLKPRVHRPPAPAWPGPGPGPGRHPHGAPPPPPSPRPGPYRE
ncbi:hypothetical protein [Nonomuraea sp. SBT364]|uniref:hypothetical protein n=1 Tax=Nonomuraea sp. SBT364 TaxID=1580530 RepID=UPI00066D3523|nr:hypothetical protein [Nonomuraea sp. SBT364]